MKPNATFDEALPWILALALGTAAALLAAWVGRRVAEVPPEDRTWRDRPPLAMRLAWWPIQWLGFYLGQALSVGERQRVLGQLRLAGMDYALSPEQFVAARWVAAAFAALLFAFVANSLRLGVPWIGVGLAAMFGHAYPGIWLRDRLNLRKRQTLKTLPFFLDMLTLCIEAGLNFTGGLQQAVAKGPTGPLREEFSRVLRDVRAGKPRAQALRQLADRMNEPAIHNLVSALIQAEQTGMDLGPVLRAQAEQRRAERFSRAEKLAMEAPVKLLFPLIAFIFPCTFIVLGFPIAMKFMYRPAQAPFIPELTWYDADHDTKTLMYDSKTGASRVELRHAFPTLIIYFVDGVAQCDRYKMNYSYKTGIVSSDGNTYGVKYDFDTGLIKSVEGRRTGPRPTLPLAWSDAWPVRKIAGQDCAQVPPAGDGAAGASACRWTDYAHARFGPLPIDLESVVTAFGYEHRWVAMSANHYRLDFGPGSELLDMDHLPDGVPVQMRSDPAPADPDDEKPSEPPSNRPDRSPT